MEATTGGAPILSLPMELTCVWLLMVERDLSLIFIPKVCHYWYTLVRDNLELQYQIELEAHGVQDNCPVEMSLMDRLQLLRHKQTAWRTGMVGDMLSVMKLPRSSPTMWAFNGNSIAYVDKAARMVHYKQLGADSLSAEDCTWPLPDVGTSLALSLDPDQDLLAIASLDTTMLNGISDTAVWNWKTGVLQKRVGGPRTNMILVTDALGMIWNPKILTDDGLAGGLAVHVVQKNASALWSLSGQSYDYALLMPSFLFEFLEFGRHEVRLYSSRQTHCQSSVFPPAPDADQLITLDMFEFNELVGMRTRRLLISCSKLVTKLQERRDDSQRHVLPWDEWKACVVWASEQTRRDAFEPQMTAGMRYVEQANVILRYFLAAGRVHVAKKLLEFLPPELASINEPEERATEYLNYRQFFNIWALLDRIVECQALETPHMTRDTRAAWLHDYKTLIVQAREQIVKLLTTDWLIAESDINGGDRRLRELTRIRQLYVPELIIRLHAMLVNSRSKIPENVKHALELANIVADSRYRLYEDFANQNGRKLGDYLGAVRQAVLAGLENGGSDPFKAIT
ncbi:hypothetical protein EWM64_g6318 [Hericium alpestre]|uniref:Nuclear pore complex protein n=1 Tax=Hericium alpestre TaxID=135208 RepID=A0A4Y9ZV02_9AGAM|nr:hypothetical protein EWM64_g6318 [Hericium alpestre]